MWLQDYRVHIKHTDGHFEHIPYFSLPANDLTDVIAPSCYSCFDYPNALADLVSLCSGTLAWSCLRQCFHPICAGFSSNVANPSPELMIAF